MKGSGLPLRIPVIEMVEIGAGGGSIARIDELERQLKRRPQDFKVLLELGKLGTITSRRPNKVYPHLQKAKSLKPVRVSV